MGDLLKVHRWGVAFECGLPSGSAAGHCFVVLLSVGLLPSKVDVLTRGKDHDIHSIERAQPLCPTDPGSNPRSTTY